jgi:hypothetical protein
MAGFFQNFAKDATSGFFGNEFLRDYQHASKAFRSNAYANAPKFKFLFHVYFDINREYLPTSLRPEDVNFGLMVKTVELPKFSAKVDVMNQYNRKRNIQTKIEYDPISMTLHDDNAGTMTTLWNSYYRYYYKDAYQIEGGEFQSKSTLGAPVNVNSKRNIYDATILNNDDWGYVGEPGISSTAVESYGVKVPFFKSIKIYGFNQHNFVMYKLLNPMIESFAHDTYDYSSRDGTMEHKLSLRYESMRYFEGALDGANPGAVVDKFGSSTDYDRVLSPIARPGSQSSVLGQGGLVSGAGGVLDDLSSGNLIGAVQKAGATVNTFKKPGALKAALKDDINRGINSAGQNPSRNTLFNFPDLVSSKKLPKF